MISTPEALRSAVERARHKGIVALDTEFVWERTYFPRLGLIQLGLSQEEVYLIDSIALDGLEELGLLLEDPGVVKIVHDAVQDLTILRRATGRAPRNVFDSQRASGFLGLPATISLQDLVFEATGVSLKKGETRTDWCKRPLSDRQVAYAEDDVRFMPAIYFWLQEKASQAGRGEWIAEEMELLNDPSTYEEPDPRTQFERVRARGLGGFSDAQRAVLRELTAWRELTARDTNRTRKAVLPDDALADIARRLPSRVSHLPKGSVPDLVRDRYGDDLIAAVEAGLAVPPSDRPARIPPSDDDERIAVRVQVVLAAIAGRCATEGIDPRLVATKSHVQDLVVSLPDSLTCSEKPLLSGWRKAFVGDEIVELLLGRRMVSLAGQDGWPRLVD